MLPIVVYLVAMVVGAASPGAAAIIFLAVPAIYFLAVTVARVRSDASSEVEDFS